MPQCFCYCGLAAILLVFRETPLHRRRREPRGSNDLEGGSASLHRHHAVGIFTSFFIRNDLYLAILQIEVIRIYGCFLLALSIIVRLIDELSNYSSSRKIAQLHNTQYRPETLLQRRLRSFRNSAKCCDFYFISITACQYVKNPANRRK